MPLTLAFVEGVVVFLAATGRYVAEGRTLASSDWSLVLAHALALTLSALFAFHFNDLYDLRAVRGFGQFAARLPQALVMTVLLVGALQVMVPGLRVGLRSLAESLLLTVALLLPLRAVFHHLFSGHPFSRRIMVLGTTELAGKLVREILREPDLRDVVVGVVDDGSAAFRPVLPSLRLGATDNLGPIIEGFEPDLIVCALTEPHDPRVVRTLLAPRARGVRVEDGIVAYERLTGKIAIECAAPRSVLFSREFEASWFTLLFARGLSVLAAACAVVVLAPLLLPVALFIKLDSDGPVFFLHPRLGLGGRPFDLIKFRTMRPGGAASEWAADNDHRTTRFGHWLRRFRIDELPQFLNILQGDMNLVGPRPHPVSNAELFTEHIPYYGLRCSVRPGLTGWAQIRYGYANTLEEETEKMRYDLHYIKHMSAAFDLRILFETVKVVLRGGRSAALDEPGAPVSPIYFGLDPAGSVRGTTTFPEPSGLRGAPLALPVGSRTSAAPGFADGASALEERRAEATRAPSRGVA